MEQEEFIKYISSFVSRRLDGESLEELEDDYKESYLELGNTAQEIVNFFDWAVDYHPTVVRDAFARKEGGHATMTLMTKAWMARAGLTPGKENQDDLSNMLHNFEPETVN